MKRITGAFRYDREFLQFRTALSECFLAEKHLPLVVNGLASGATEAWLAETARILTAEGRNLLLLLPTENEARAVASFLSLAEVPSAYYPTRDFITHTITASHDIERERLSVLQRLLKGGFCAIATPASAMQLTLPKEMLKENSASLSVGDEIVPEELAKKLLRMGFSAVETVEGAGQYARRGGIFDIYSPAEDAPVRIELFGDEIDRMAVFDPITQRVIENATSLSILPAKEVLTDAEAIQRIRKAAGHRLAKANTEFAKNSLQNELYAIDSGLDLAFADKYISVVYDTPGSLFSFLSACGTPVIFTVGSNAVKKACEDAEQQTEEECDALVKEGLLSARYARFSLSAEEMRATLDESVSVHVNTFSSGLGGLKTAGLFGFRTRSTPFYGDNLSLLSEDLTTLCETGQRVLIAAGGTTAQAALADALRERGLSSVVMTEETSVDAIPYGGIGILPVALDNGFELMNARMSVISLTEKRDRAVAHRRAQKRAVKRMGAGKRILSYAELSPGDYVVHDNHGIGQYEGLESMTIGGVTRDYVTVRYAGTDKIHIPADKIDTISRYIGARAEDGTVKLSRVGGTEWFRAKERARRAAKDIARDLVQLYAARQRKPGFAFPRDCDMEREFAMAFGYEETEPQLLAIEEIKADMLRPCPMDRLLCGDVGFGKTEVAFRAIFKAIIAGKQAAILVPTTILALQHYETALSRFRGYPVTIEMLSSFRTPTQQEKILRRLRRGEVDLIIGTHSLLAKRVEFRDLGLLVVDEEQRFGVGQKEKLKQMAEGVDVLTLSATPIPRTLNMAMSGIRDMSILDEAPLDRFPVQTYVLEHDEGIILDAIRRELRRGGQVLYLYNRVGTIDVCAAKIALAIPDARVVYAHGQMEKAELEDIWQSLVRGDIDILVCTTIIETGVDLPNANTLVIEDADRMGLSQLHQLRGRVGRSGRHAYAYFTYRRGKTLSEIAEKRLSAIRDYAEFGAGFRIALRDLEIRGAGNLLGAEQHGHIDAVGYDMYVKILNHAILEEKGELLPTPFESKIDLPVDALIPSTYISSAAQRMEMYKKISLIRTEEDMRDVLDEFCDRFGDVPCVTERLLKIALCRASAEEARIDRVALAGKELRFVAEKNDLGVWSELFHEENRLSFSGGTRPYVAYRLRGGEDATDAAVKILTLYVRVMRAPSAEI